MSEKETWTSPEERRVGHSPNSPADLEFLDRLVAKGEALMLKDSWFGCADNLIRTKLAEIAGRYEIGDFVIYRLEPTEAGKTLAGIREAAKLERRSLLPPKEKT